MTGSSYRLWNFKLSRNFTILFYFVDSALSQASLISAAFISLERFHAIFWPLKHRTLPIQAYRVGISVVWVLSILVSTIFNLLLWLKTSKECLYFWTPYAVTILLVLCSCKIGIWRKSQHRAVACFATKHSKFAATVKDVVVCINARFNLLAPLSHQELLILCS